MKKLLAVITAAACLSFAFTGCKKQSKITLTMWHVYGEQADSPMNDYVQEFNSTIGKDKGIIVNVTLMSNASQIGEKLLNAQHGKAGVPSMPDLFFCHASNAEELGEENLVNWRDKFTKQELDGFVQGFLSDGTVNGALSVLPVSKSTHLLFLAGNAFNRFAEKSGVTYDDLATWDGFFATAEKYYEYSHGKPFCALDYLIRAVELDAISRGDGLLRRKRLVQGRRDAARRIRKIRKFHRQRAYSRFRFIFQHAGNDWRDRSGHIFVRRRIIL